MQYTECLSIQKTFSLGEIGVTNAAILWEYNFLLFQTSSY